MVKIKDILEDLKKVNGLDNIDLLSEKDKDIIRNLEEDNNLGVFECINRDYVIVITHNAEFRVPEKDMTIEKDDKIIFPGLDFPEVKAKNVVSSSPGINVHNYLKKRFNLSMDDEHATLLIGFNL